MPPDPTPSLYNFIILFLSSFLKQGLAVATTGSNVKVSCLILLMLGLHHQAWLISLSLLTDDTRAWHCNMVATTEQRCLWFLRVPPKPAIKYIKLHLHRTSGPHQHQNADHGLCTYKAFKAEVDPRTCLSENVRSVLGWSDGSEGKIFIIWHDDMSSNPHYTYKAKLSSRNLDLMLLWGNVRERREKAQEVHSPASSSKQQTEGEEQPSRSSSV